MSGPLHAWGVRFRQTLKAISLTLSGALTVNGSSALKDLVIFGGGTSTTKGLQFYFDTSGNIAWLLSFEQGVNWYQMNYDATSHRFHINNTEKFRITATQTLAPDGDASAPGQSFLNEPDCGWYKSGTNEISAATAGAQRVIISSAGVVTVTDGTGSISLTPSNGGIPILAIVKGGSSDSASVRNDYIQSTNISSGADARLYPGYVALTDGISAPSTALGFALIYVDTSDGDLKVKFGDGTVKTIVTDT